jgi:L-lactate permease
VNPPPLWRWVAAGMCVLCWLTISLFFFVSLQLLTVDEEWKGWWDVWPVLVIYGIGTAIAGVVVTALLRPRFRPRKSS